MSLTVRGLRKSFSGQEVLQPLDLDVPEGSVTVVVGPSGSGKSTLLRCIAGLETVDDGTISLRGEDVTKHPPGRRDVAMVFQDHALYPHLDVRTNIAFPLMARKAPKEEMAGAVRRAAERLDIVDLLDRRPGELSGGERRRVALARAVVRKPHLFLMDEPLSNLDPGGRRKVLQEIKSLLRSLKTTTVYVTHDQAEAMLLADQLVVLHGGRIEQMGPPAHVHDAPANVFVARFMGTLPLNVVPAALMADAPSEAAYAAIRPEHCAIVTAGEGELTLRVVAVDRLGGDTVVTGEIGNDTLQIRGGRDVLPAKGAAVGVSFSRGSVLWFGRDGNAL